MVDDRFNKFLTVVIILVLIGLFIVLGFWGYDVVQKYYIKTGAEGAVDEFDQKILELDLNTVNENTNTVSSNEENEIAQNVATNTNSSKSKSSSGAKTSTVQMKYKGFDVAGKIEIPKTKIKYPILTVATVSSMKVSIGIVYGPGPNKVGNTVLMGHNYRNGALFSNNKKLEVGDVVYITDLTGQRLKYVIYNKYVTTSTDFDYATRDTEGRREITMESCTDDSKERLILYAKEEQ